MQSDPYGLRIGVANRQAVRVKLYERENLITETCMAYSISNAQLATNEFVSMGSIRIDTIPHISIIDDRQDLANVIAQQKGEIGRMLNELHQFYRTTTTIAGAHNDISIEVIWATNAVQNQAYRAEIKIYIVLRAIDASAQKADRLVSDMLEICTSTLSLQKYEFSDVSGEEILRVSGSIDDSIIKAIVKEEKAENLQNQILPICYSFDRFSPSDSDWNRIVNALIDYPNCAISFQFIPTEYQYSEKTEIDRISQMLDTLNRGIMEQGVGNISFTLAARHAEMYRYYADHKTAPLFRYNILIYGNETSAGKIAGRMFGQLSSAEKETVALKTLDLRRSEVDKNRNFYPLPWAVNEILLSRERNMQIWNSGYFSPDLYSLPYIITTEEACELFRLPIGSDQVSAGFSVNESGKGRKRYSSNIINSGDISIGKLRSSANNDTIGISLKDLAKHMLVVGTPGSGKTTFSVGLLDPLWKQHGIPFLVIEPAKNEYRALIQSIPELQVFTPGKNFISPFVFNPFVPPKNVTLETYKSTLKTAFSAAVSMSTPLDKIFEETVNNCYSDFRWLDTYTVSDKGKIFNISDFIKCFQQTFDEIGYTGDARNIGRAGVVRLNGLAKLFDNYHSIPIEDLLQKPTVIELAAIENSDEKALIIALLLLSILAYVNANYVGEGGLKNVILLEEAHVLLDASSNAGQGDANPSAIAQGLVKRMLAEIRSYGVGIVIADQSPRKVSTDVVALTDMKMTFRLVETEDKQIIGDSTNMSDTQIQRLTKLKPGEAFLFFNKLDAPEEVITPDYRLENAISISLSDAGISKLSTYWNDKKGLLRPYPECRICRYCTETCDYARRVLAREIARRIFTKHIKAGAKDFELVRKVFSHISKLVVAELNDEPFTPELFSCVKVHLWRRIKYNTSIKITDTLIENSVRK